MHPDNILSRKIERMHEKGDLRFEIFDALREALDESEIKGREYYELLRKLNLRLDLGDWYEDSKFTSLDDVQTDDLPFDVKIAHDILWLHKLIDKDKRFEYHVEYESGMFVVQNFVEAIELGPDRATSEQSLIDWGFTS